MNYFRKAIEYTKPSYEIDEKIKYLDKEIEKVIGLNIKLTDPKTFKNVEASIVYNDVISNVDQQITKDIYNLNKKINKKFLKRSVKTKKDTSRSRWLRRSK